MYDNKEPLKCDPPGTFREVIAHPGGHDRAIEKAVIMEHRFAFFFWMKWKRELEKRNWLDQPAPTLVTIDWHRDLAPPPDDQKEELKKLRDANLSDISNYVWAQFDQTNDGHILCAAWLSLVGDIILLKNSAGEMQNSFTDARGNDHTIYEFRDYNRFEDFICDRNDHNIFLDIDLDYFIHGKGNVFYPGTFELYSEEEIKSVVDYGHPVFKHILPNIDGLTLAQEPSYCGGIANSCHIMKIVNEQLFDKQNDWKHLKEK